MVSWATNEQLSGEHQVMREICYNIARGVFSPGDAMPSPHALSQDRMINPRIVELAYAKLAKAGILNIPSSENYHISAEAQPLAREFLLVCTKKELRDFVEILKCAGLSTGEIQAIFREASDA